MDGFFPGLRRIARHVRPMITALLVVTCIAMLVQSADDFNMQELTDALSAIAPWQWFLAFVATSVSFVAVGQYDVLFHRWLDTGVSPRRAARSGAASIALAQTLGFGLFTGTFARWRILPEISFARAIALTHYVSVSFMIALGVVCAVVVPFTIFVDRYTLFFFTSGAVLMALLAAIWSLRRPSFLPFHLPPLGIMASLSVWMLCDVFFAALAFYVLLPPDISVAYGPFFAAFVIALSAGLSSGAPGGVGPFEVCFLTLMPLVATHHLLATILAFRLIYYALPAVAGMVCLIRPTAPQMTSLPQTKRPIARAETYGLLRQTGHRLRMIADQQVHIAETSRCLVMIGDPCDGAVWSAAGARALHDCARQRGLSPALYKARPETAAQAKRAGWSVLRIGEEAVLEPEHFSLEGPARRQLRRKLKQAEKSGISVISGTDLPYQKMQAVAQDWADLRSGERGFSMGRFDPMSLTDQRCFLAYRGSELVAFASFHHTPQDWCLDLMRAHRNAGDGAMHALIVAALRQAANEHVKQLSLAAMAPEDPSLALRLFTDGAGLRQFKLSFAPKSIPLYLAAPTPVQLALAGLDILLRIRFPDTLRPPSAPAALQKLQGRFSFFSVVQDMPDTQFGTEHEISHT